MRPGQALGTRRFHIIRIRCQVVLVPLGKHSSLRGVRCQGQALHHNRSKSGAKASYLGGTLGFKHREGGRGKEESLVCSR